MKHPRSTSTSKTRTQRYTVQNPQASWPLVEDLSLEKQGASAMEGRVQEYIQQQAEGKQTCFSEEENYREVHIWSACRNLSHLICLQSLICRLCCTPPFPLPSAEDTCTWSRNRGRHAADQLLAHCGFLFSDYQWLVSPQRSPGIAVAAVAVAAAGGGGGGGGAMAVGFQWSMYSAVLLLSVHAAQAPQSLQGLSCVNDFVTNVICTWNHSLFHPSSDCWVSGVKATYVIKDNRREPVHTVHRCKLKQRGKYPGCSFSFDTTFNPFETIPNISVTCNSTLIEAQLNYSAKQHIKMHPPGTPKVNHTVNMTRISWSLGSPRSKFLKSFDFQVQIKQAHQSWDEVKSQPSKVCEMIIWQKLRGHLQVRVRIKSLNWKGGQWSEWSPTTSWVTEEQEQALFSYLGQPAVIVFVPLALSLGLSFVSMLALYRCCVWKRLLREKTVPNPSKYFCTLHSVYGGNFKKWLNPMPVPESFFVSHQGEDISAVEVCDSWDVVPVSSPSSSSALIHSPSANDPLSSCSSSFFSNMDYFMSSCNSSSSHACTSPHFSYQGNVLSSHRKLHLSLCPSFISSSIYESLRREPQSPDSGFEVGRFEELDTEALYNNQSSPLLLHLPLSVSSFSPTSPIYPSDMNLVFDNQALEEDAPVNASPAVSEHLSGWPVTEPMCRASSLPVDTCKSGYLTLKELHTTFSNKSI